MEAEKLASIKTVDEAKKFLTNVAKERIVNSFDAQTSSCSNE